MSIINVKIQKKYSYIFLILKNLRKSLFNFGVVYSTQNDSIKSFFLSVCLGVLSIHPLNRHHLHLWKMDKIEPELYAIILREIPMN